MVSKSGRTSGLSDQHLSINSTNLAPTVPGVTAGTGGLIPGVFQATAPITWFGGIPRYGSCWVIISHNTTANEKTSAFSLYGSHLSTSGAVQYGVPVIVDTKLFALTRENPKSATTARQCLSTKILSDLISRCKNFLPLFTDANQTLFSRIKSGENVRIELDEDDDSERTIEMNLMFCPNIDSSSSSESDNDDDKQIKSPSLQINKKNNQVNIVEIQSTNKLEENVNN